VGFHLVVHGKKCTVFKEGLSRGRVEAPKPALYKAFAAERASSILKRNEFVDMSRHGSWLNMAEIEISVLNRVALKQRTGSSEQLQKQIKIYLKE
jgi:uncharacterized phage-associated protein